MELHHEFTVPSSLADTWAAFNQLEDIAPCFPGATLTGVDGDTFTGTVKVKLGPIAMLYAGTGEFLSRDEDNHTVVIKAIGKDKRGNGTAGATVTAVMSADGDATTVSVTTDMNVTGKPAQFGRGVIQDISDKLLAQFVQCIISKAGPDPEPVDPVPDPEPADPVPVETPVVDPAHPVVEPAETKKVSTGSTTAGSSSASQPAAELDLGATVWPVLARRFGPPIALALAVVVLIVWLKGRRHR